MKLFNFFKPILSSGYVEKSAFVLKTGMPKVLMWFKLIEKIQLKTSNNEIQNFN